MVTRVYAGSPAYEQGLNAGDQIVAADNMRASREFLLARLAEKKPGDIIRLTIFRFDDCDRLKSSSARVTGRTTVLFQWPSQ